jgi:putative tryptophan/tyrosine transport system substrate-binding protein
MQRRQFIAGIGSAAAWTLAARAQPDEQVRRIGALMSLAERDPQGAARVAAFREALAALGWTEGRNMRIDFRWAGGDIQRARTFASELIGLQPDVLLASGTPELAALRQAARTIPIVFHGVTDPVGQGFVASLLQPGGNITGFTNIEPSLAGKWVQVLKLVAPGLQRAAYLFNPETAPFAGQMFRGADAAAGPLMIRLTAAAVRDDAEVEKALSSLAAVPNSGFILNPEVFMANHRERIIALAIRHRLPAIYPFRNYAVDGGLIAYGVDLIEPFREAATYIDKILRGTKPADLPVRMPTKYDLVVNLKTAKAMSFDVPADMLSIANEVIE